MRFRWVVIVLGVALALVAIRLDDRRVAWVALGVLSLALLLRFATPRPGTIRDEPDHPTDGRPHDSSAST
jgi:hypothetical protein